MSDERTPCSLTVRSVPHGEFRRGPQDACSTDGFRYVLEGAGRRIEWVLGNVFPEHAPHDLMHFVVEDLGALRGLMALVLAGVYVVEDERLQPPTGKGRLSEADARVLAESESRVVQVREARKRGEPLHGWIVEALARCEAARARLEADGVVVVTGLA